MRRFRRSERVSHAVSAELIQIKRWRLRTSSHCTSVEGPAASAAMERRPTRNIPATSTIFPRPNRWAAGHHAPEDSFYLWGPQPPDDFALNHEIDGEAV
jgi:hypothetical protein